ncbi:MAG: hypothetical protein ACRCV7_00845 [Culicoidibacterales bacterium]
MQVQFNDVIEQNYILWSENESGKVVITFLQDHFIQRFFRKIFHIKIPKQKDIVLDEKTSIIWKLIDGNKTVKDVYAQFQHMFPEETSDDLEARFGTVVHYFISQKWIKVKER